eukprot:1159491-Pelagomonas_calceolata.AAC.1
MSTCLPGVQAAAPAAEARGDPVGSLPHVASPPGAHPAARLAAHRWRGLKSGTAPRTPGHHCYLHCRQPPGGPCDMS